MPEAIFVAMVYYVTSFNCIKLTQVTAEPAILGNAIASRMQRVGPQLMIDLDQPPGGITYYSFRSSNWLASQTSRDRLA